jgi:hypothetical protein
MEILKSHLGGPVNLTFLSPRQQKGAKRARELYESMGTPTVDNLKAMICMNLIKNNVVTTDDINLATKAYGPDVGDIKGETTRGKPTPVISNIVEIPDELLEVQQYLVVSMDGLTESSLKFLSTIFHELCYRTAQHVANPVASAYKKCISELLGVYKKGGFNVTEIHCDNEFCKVMDPLLARQNRRAEIEKRKDSLSPVRTSMQWISTDYWLIPLLSNLSPEPKNNNAVVRVQSYPAVFTPST